MAIVFSSEYPVASYSVAVTPWAESFGNHRAVIEVPSAAEAVYLDIFWRRHDPDPAGKRFIITEATTGDTVPEIYRLSVDNERCRIVFGPVGKPGRYYFYYLPYEVQENWGFYDKDYLRPEGSPSEKWVKKTGLGKNVDTSHYIKARLITFQSRTAFDSFYPMEIIPLSYEKRILIAKHSENYLVFPEDRKYPIKMKDEIPLRWIEKGPSGKFTGEAYKNEYYVFQIGVYASKTYLRNIKILLTDLKSKGNTIPVSSITCFNTGGIGPYGNQFEKRVDLESGKVQPFWIGVDISESTPAGIYRGRFAVQPEGMPAWVVDVSIKVNNEVIKAKGDNEPWRHSRLRWLNSTLGIDDKPTKQYEPIEFLGENTLRLTEKKITISPGGMPGSLKVKTTEILDSPILFIVDSERGTEKFSAPEDVTLLKNEPGIISGSWNSRSGAFEMKETASVESDGYINYKLQITALNNIRLNDIRLEIPFSSAVAEYVIGMGHAGSTVPKETESKWIGPHDSFWIGNSDAGLWCELRGSSYHGPLLNLYRPEYPVSWYNEDKGGFRLKKDNNVVKAVIYSGNRIMKKGETLDFEWSLLMTPVKKINYKSQFLDRYYHNGGNPTPSDDDLACGVKVVNIHHANNYNPHINYPFIEVDSMKWFVKKMHDKGMKVKIYYTIRELTNYTTELWALRSLGDEILGDGDGGGYPWLREHLISGYRPQWYQHFPDKSPDASIVNSPGESRWYNYYIEGLAWLVRNVDIDGLYLDDVTYDRRTLKRIRKVLDNEKPGCIIDLHSNTGFSKGPANQYAEFFPYIDKLWFGESFQYDIMAPENWFVEVSGIPFGLMGDMLQGGGNRWRGMVYGMTVRYPWISEEKKCDPRPVWEIWDKFRIETSVMKGYWEKDCPVKTSCDDIKVTVYQKNEESLISLASWAEEAADVSLTFDWKQLGIDPGKAVLKAPFIKDFQEERTFMPDDPIPVDPGRGWLLFIGEYK